MFALGEVDDSAAPNTGSYFIFTAFALAVIIIMMVRPLCYSFVRLWMLGLTLAFVSSSSGQNILIAIVR